ncbi:septation protein SepH [Modestobacter sp. NPDC049651]|uniref:septation protein SepH n=1 Tax=unclassified Modestobacter TaxID=2643866 RepID=UPI0033E0FDA9
MRSLRLVALSDDGKRLVLAPDVPESMDSGERFEVAIDDRLRAAVRGDQLRPAQTSLDLGNALPPRVIQARIRAGETPEQVAHASGTSVERIMRFAHPVLQERTRVAEQAREAKVRLSEGTPTVPLEQFMAERLRLLGADLDAVRWDAHRAEDGTWQVRAAWRAGHKSGTTRWRYDIPTKTVAPIDAATTDFAEGTRLVRVVPDVPAGVTVLRARQHGDDHDGTAAGLADDDLELPDDEHGTAGDAEPAGPRAGHDEDDVRNVVPVDGVPVDVLLATSDEIPHDLATQDTVVLGDLTDEETSDPRARIPAWEDIVFGVRRHR